MKSYSHGKDPPWRSFWRTVSRGRHHMPERRKTVTIAHGSNPTPEQGSVTLSSGSNPTPEKGKNVPVSRGRNPTPEKGKNVPVSRGRNPTPEKGKNVPVSSGRNPTPEKEKNVPVSSGRNLTPEKGKNVPVSSGRNLTPEKGKNVPVSSGRNLTPEKGKNVPVSSERNPTPEKGKNVPVSRGSNPTPEKGKNVPVSSGRNPTPEKGKNVPVSRGSNPIMEQGKSVPVSSGRDPIPEHEKSVTVSRGSDPMPEQGKIVAVSSGSNPSPEQGKSAIGVSSGSDSIPEQGKSVIISSGNNPIPKLGESVTVSNGNKPILEQGESLNISSGRDPMLEQGKRVITVSSGSDLISEQGKSVTISKGSDPIPKQGKSVTVSRESDPVPEQGKSVKSPLHEEGAAEMPCDKPTTAPVPSRTELLREKRCQSATPPPLLSPQRSPGYPLSDSEDSSHSTGLSRVSRSRLCLKDWNSRTSTLRSTSMSPSDSDSPSHPLKAISVGALDKRLSVLKADHKESPNEAQDGEAIGSHPLTQSTLSLGTATKLRTLSISRVSVRSQALDIRQKITEWECRRELSPRTSVCVDKRDAGERLSGESCPSVLTSPCSDKTFDFKGLRRMSRTFSECSYPETEEEELLDRDSRHRFEKRPGRSEPPSATFLKSHVRKESSAVLNRIQKIEQALKEQSGRGLPQLPSSCYSVDKGRKKSGTLSTVEGLSETLSDSKGGSVIFGSEPETPPEAEKSSKTKQGVTANSAGPKVLRESAAKSAVNPVPKPKRTFEYEADKSHKSKPSNGLPPSPTPAAPPPLPSTPAPPVTRRQKKESRFHRKSQNRKSFEFEDASSLQSLYPPSPTENGTESQHKFGSKSTLEENAYEDIVGESPKENPYEDVELKGRHAGRKSHQLSENSLDSLHRMWTPQNRKYTAPAQLPSKAGSHSLRVGNWSERKSHRLPRLPKRHSHDDMLLLAQLGIPSSPSGLHEDSLSAASELLSTRRARRIPKLVQRINSIYSAKRGKKRLKKLSMSNIETASLRDENSESESDSDDRFKAHTQRLVHIQSMLKRAPSYRTLELELIEWQERELFEYFVVVSLKKKPSKNTYIPEVTYQFPKLERPTKQMREAEERLKAIPQFCFPDAKDWLPVSEYNSETFSFMLTGEDGSRRFGYCRRLLPNGKGPRLPEVYCVISRLGCFDLFSKILDEVERRRGISAALVYPFMRSLMESPFPAPGKTIKVKTFLPGAGNEVIELRRPMDSRLEHVDFECLFRCLSMRQIIRIFASLLLERRVIFVADKLSTLSSCSHAVVALLYPFSWQHTFIPVLPSSMIDIVCCPTPFLVGLLSSSLPKLKDLPVEEALMVNLGSDRFIRQMDDEDTLLPRKLQAALEQALERKNELINQDSDSDSDDECNTLNGLVSEVFIRFFVETVGHYSLFLTQNEKGERAFQREAFRKSVASKSIRRFLEVFMESQMFAGFIQDRELRKCRAKGLFEQRVEQYLEELPDTEQSGVNKFLRGLGNKMKFLHKKN
ncbi:DENN domain-containing protein 2B isoform X1 [Hirundo rustica]|uniref:DENN domain-containing protein 2B isoform X1 n=1 Tax=Hirundo rustica TaxID=43150 RepID=UPI001A952134|nr:DENN domain-containing protein 2B isoform X1 [Hirundo rustica]